MMELINKSKLEIMCGGVEWEFKFSIWDFTSTAETKSGFEFMITWLVGWKSEIWLPDSTMCTLLLWSLLFLFLFSNICIIYLLIILNSLTLLIYNVT